VPSRAGNLVRPGGASCPIRLKASYNFDGIYRPLNCQAIAMENTAGQFSGNPAEAD